MIKWCLGTLPFNDSSSFIYFVNQCHHLFFSFESILPLSTSRETLVSSVFRDSIAPPTMTLEEYGDIQLAEAQERAAR